MPIAVKWDKAFRCYLSCRHCYYGQKRANRTLRTSDELDTASALGVLETLADGGASEVNLLGGESLMRGDVPELVAAGTKLGLWMSLNTSAVALKEPVASQLIDAGIRGLAVSIDGPTRESHEITRGRNTFRHTHQNTLEFIRLACEKGRQVHVTVNSILHHYNQDLIPEFFEYILALRPSRWNILSLISYGVIEPFYEELKLSPEEKLQAAVTVARLYSEHARPLGELRIEIAPRFLSPLMWEAVKEKTDDELPFGTLSCDGGDRLAYVDPKGFLYPCDRYLPSFPPARDNEPALPRENLCETPFRDARKKQAFQRIDQLRSDAATYRHYEPCSSCRWRTTGICAPCQVMSAQVVYEGH